jgi:hypothetical protein
MQPISDDVLLQQFRLCRADLIAALKAGRMPANAHTLREIADLQLAIMATEGTIFDKANPDFLCEWAGKEAA